MLINNDFSVQQVKEVCLKFFEQMNSVDDLYDEMNEFKKTLEIKSIPVVAKDVIQNKIESIEMVTKQIFNEQIILIKELIDYVFENNIKFEYKETADVASYRIDDGSYPTFIHTTFSGVLGEELYNLLHQEQLFSLYYQGKNLPAEQSFKKVTDKASFIETLNHYVCEGEPI